RTYYAFHLCPGFWDSLIWLHSKGRIFSLDKVREEICDGEGDSLIDWAKLKMPKEAFFASDDPDVIHWYGKMQEWANASVQFSDAAKAEFATVADAWLVAYAKAKNLTLVSREIFAPDIKWKIPIPNVCMAREFQVSHIDTFVMLERLGVQFSWKE
ncbi:MAG TPA: DUF4411 family protein, partial [Verrucomicrobiae bacterium]|nr:DUF4411 family protein [Verrucomicrobiae bacterium]